MAEQSLQLYEAMFLVEPDVAADWEAAKGMVQRIMDRAKANMLSCRLWDEKRLAYPINKHKRAVYILSYFRAHGSAISGIERDVQLSEHLLRVLVLRADHITDEELEEIKATPERRVQPAPARQAVEAVVEPTAPGPEVEQNASIPEKVEEDTSIPEEAEKNLPVDNSADEIADQTVDKSAADNDQP